MVFTSFSYLLLFLPVVVLASYLCRKYNHLLSIAWVTLASLGFYAFWEMSQLPILSASILFNYTCGALIGTGGRFRKTYLFVGIAANIGLLGYFKYTNFFVNTLNMLREESWHVETIVLPLAISFFTFQQIAWLMDQYRSEAPKCTFVEYVCAVTFFPHLIAGPIVRYHDLIPQFQAIKVLKPDWDIIAKGLFIIGCGVFKKIVIADTLAVYATLCFDQLEVLNMLQAWLAVLSYTMQIYFDFSGYCDIAIGSALLLNIHLPANFHSPYKASSIREFWQRWHITLGSFLTRYLYFPLGGNRKGLVRTCGNIFLVMFLSGLWHGAGFGFILWGMLHGAAMVLQRGWNAAGLHVPAKFSTAITFLFVALAWVFFRASDIDTAMKVYSACFGMTDVVLPRPLQPLLPDAWGITYLPTSKLFGVARASFQETMLALAGSMLCVFSAKEAGALWDKYAAKQSGVLYILNFIAAVLLFVSFMKMLVVPYTEFIYFNF